MRALVSLLFLLLALHSFSQQDSLRPQNRPDSAVAYRYRHRMDTLYFKQDAIRLTYNYNGGHLITAGYTIEKLDYIIDMPIPTNRIGPTVSAGFMTKNRSNYFSGSFSYSAHIFHIYGVINASYFTDFKAGSVYVIPEIGATIVGMIYIGYGRYIRVMDKLNLGFKNQLTVGFNWPIPYTARKYYILGKRAEYLDRRM